MGLYRDTIRRIGRTRGWAAIGKHAAPPLDRLVSRLSGGKRTAANMFLPTFILVNRGAKSGKEYHTPLSYVREGDTFFLAATNFGQKHHPGWSANLLAHPDVEIVFEGRTIPVWARRLNEEEKAELWPRFVNMWPAYGDYVVRSGRNIRLFALEPRS